MSFPDIMLLVGSIGIAVLAGGVFLLRLAGAARDLPSDGERPAPETAES